MKRTFAAVGAIALVALPAPIAAADEPTQQDRTNAAQECRSERGSTAATREAFAQRYGTQRSNRRNAFGRCVSQRARDEMQERTTARRNASQQCREEQGTTPESEAAFNAKYGTNGNDRNSFGRCVSQKARENEEQADAQDAEERQARRNAARECRRERGSTPESRATFNSTYGRNANDRNAFGKCVSQKAREQQESAS